MKVAGCVQPKNFPIRKGKQNKQILLDGTISSTKKNDTQQNIRIRIASCVLTNPGESEHSLVSQRLNKLLVSHDARVDCFLCQSLGSL